LQAFFDEQKREHVERLLSAVRKPVRDTMKEAQLAGKVEAYEQIFPDLERFAEEAMRNASQ
jgi:hypothetical protein